MDKKYYSVIIGEEVGTKIKAFLIAPKHTSIKVGDIMVRMADMPTFTEVLTMSIVLNALSLGRPVAETAFMNILNTILKK